MKKIMSVITIATNLILIIVSCSDGTGPKDVNGSTTAFEWCFVPAGPYTYGFPENDKNYKGLRTIDYDYEIMKYEVTNKQYLTYLRQAYDSGDINVDSEYGIFSNQIVVEGYYIGDEYNDEGNYVLYSLNREIGENNISRIWYIDGDFFLDVPSGFSEGEYLNHPITDMTWFGAWHFADFYGWRLPNSREWEKAARGMTGYTYPWGNKIDGRMANYKDSGDPFDNGTTPVGYYNGINTVDINAETVNTINSVSPYGLYDMSGNASNWIHDWWYDAHVRMSRVVRGGTWENNYPTGSYPPYFSTLQAWAPSFSWTGSGIRCVRSVEPSRR